MKKNRWIAVLAVMVMALAGCSDPSSGGSGNLSGAGNSGVDNPVSQQPDYSKCVVGDFVLKDGTVLSKDENPESGTVAAVIVRAAADDKPALGVGIVHNQSGLAWCKDSATGYSTNITTLRGDEISGYMDGSDGWESLKEACSDAESNPDKYPAWNYSLTYAKNNGLTGDLATGWYLPTVAELYTIYQNETAVGASLAKVGGNQFGTRGTGLVVSTLPTVMAPGD